MRARPNPSQEPERLADTLARLAGMDLEGLRRRWRSRFGRAAPPALSRTLLYRALAYRIQADALGELDRAAIQALVRLADDPDAAVPALPELRAMKPGTLLVEVVRCELVSALNVPAFPKITGKFRGMVQVSVPRLANSDA